MHTLLQDLAVVMIVAAIVTIICHRFKQPVVLGYILAGVLIGPHTPPFPLIRDEGTINTLAEFGVILLMFSLGLEFSLGKLKRVGGTAFIAAFLEIFLMIWVGYQIGRLFGWGSMDSLFLGAILSISSSTIIVKVLGELGKSREPFAQLIFGVLIIEDILAIAMIALLSSIATTGALHVGEVGLTLGKLAIFLVTSLVVGIIAVPRLLRYVASFKSNEMLTITVLGLCFGFSLLAVKLGYSVALGAFLIGAIIAEAREIHRIEVLVEPVRDMFSAIFFVTIGLLIDPAVLAEHWQAILVITAAVVFGKVLACSFGTFISGKDTRTSLRVGMGLAQIGEFSFIIASLGLTLKVTSPFLYPIAVAVSVLTTLCTPYLIKSADGAANWFGRRAPQPLQKSLALYTQWIGQLGSQQSTSFAAKLRRQWLGLIALNAFLIAAIFIAAAFAEKHPPAWLPDLGLGQEMLKAAFWLAAVLLSLPLLVASFRKLQALGLLLAETTVSQASAGARTQAIRSIVATLVPTAGAVVLGLYILILSSTLLPAWNVLAILLLVIALTTWLLWRSFIRVYSRAQFALKETLADPPTLLPSQLPPLPPLLHEASLELFHLPPHAPVVGKMIRELSLRTLTGASIVGIERRGENIINPGPDEELHADDQVLLLGTRAQLDAVRAYIASQEST